MVPTRQTNFRLEENLLEALQAIRERDGIPVAEQVRRAIRLWLDSKGINVKKAATRSTRPRRKS